MIWIRADANKEIGSGHVMRCLSIAAALKERGKEVCFLAADESTGDFLKLRGQEYIVLGSAYSCLEEEIERLITLLKEEKVEWLLIDSYYATEQYMRQLRPHVRIAYVDDLARYAYPVDMIINYNIYGDSIPYRKMEVYEESVCLLGPAYAPIREQFRKVGYGVRQTAENVLLTTGGSDKFNLAELILKEVLERGISGKLHYHVVSGALNVNYPALEALAEQYENVHLYQNVADMAGLMQRCDIAIAAGGSTMYELSAVGVPTICFAFVDNQERIVEAFCQKGYAAYGGNYMQEKECFASKVADFLEELVEREDLRQCYSQKMRSLVDGNGAGRIADALGNGFDEKD